MASGIAAGLKDNGIHFTCIVSARLADSWSERHPELAEHLRPITIHMDAGSSWQSTLRRILPRNALVHRGIKAVRSLRSRSTRRALGMETVWLPFHRVPLASSRGVVTIHDLRVFEPGLSSEFDQQIITKNVEAAKALVCSWPHPYRSVCERFPEAAGKTFLIPLPVLNPGRYFGRRRVHDGTHRLLLPGFVTPHKNHELVIRALPSLPDAVAVFTGSEDGTHGESLRALAATLGVSDRIEWRGFVTAEQLEHEYERATLLVMPTRWEAASGPVYEAISRGLPFVASDIAPIRSQLDALRLTAELFDCDSVDEFTIAVTRTLTDYASYANEIDRVAPTVRERTWEATAADYSRVFAWVGGYGDLPVDLMMRTTR